MDAATAIQRTVGDIQPWVGMTLDYSEKLAAALPEDMLDWRPTDPSGKFCFSLGEIIMHITDARIMFISQLSGEDVSDRYWSSGPSEDGVWKFSEYSGKQEIIDRLATSRKEIDAWLAKPESALLETTDGTMAVFAKHLEQMKERGMDVADLKRRGPANLNRVLVALTVHEAGHRGSLQTLMRQQGINPGAGE